MSDAHAEHDHPPHLGHHWETPQQQFEAGKLGMWLFLATEVLLFGGLFCAYTIWRYLHPEMFRFGSTFLDTKMGAINTAVLIASSLTMAIGVTMAQKGKTRELVICLVLTLAGAGGFLVIKYFEYSHKFHEGYYPGIRFYEKHDYAHNWSPDAAITGMGITELDVAANAPAEPAALGLPDTVTVELPAQGPPVEAPAGINTDVLNRLEVARVDPAAVKAHGEGEHPHEIEPGQTHGGDHGHVHSGNPPTHPLQDPGRPANAHMFFNIYFMMTGLHGVHVIIGAIVILWLLVNAVRGKYSSEYFTEVDLGGLYWHVVDLIWIFLFPLFYLI